MKIFPKYELGKLADVERGSVFAIFRSEFAMGLVVSDWQVPSAKCWITFSEGVHDKKWTVLQIDPATEAPVLVFDRARIAVSFEPMGAGSCNDAKLAGSVFMMEGKIALSGLLHQQRAAAFNVEDGSHIRAHHPALPYFSSWAIEVPDGVNWRTIFSREATVPGQSAKLALE